MQTIAPIFVASCLLPLPPMSPASHISIASAPPHHQHRHCLVLVTMFCRCQLMWVVLVARCLWR
eukprot:10343277-Alexandrium_andersonii.AAC.1